MKNKIYEVVKLVGLVMLALALVIIAKYIVTVVIAMVIAYVRPDIPVTQIVDIAEKVGIAVLGGVGACITLNQPIREKEFRPLLDVIKEKIKERKENKK